MTYEYPRERPGCASTMVIISPNLDKILLGKRKPTSEAFPSYWCLPGGMLEVAKERTVTTARRETREECGVDIPENRWVLFMVDDTPGDDPRYDQIINVCYYTHLNPDEYNAVKADDDIVAVKWVSVKKATKLDLAFNHNGVLDEFIERTDIII